MSESHDQDDLPPGKEPPHDSKFSIMLGEVAGAAVWIVIILAVAAGIAWALMRAMS